MTAQVPTTGSRLHSWAGGSGVEARDENNPRTEEAHSPKEQPEERRPTEPALTVRGDALEPSHSALIRRSSSPAPQPPLSRRRKRAKPANTRRDEVCSA